MLGYHAAEVATTLDASEESVTSALKRARATLRRHQALAPTREPPPPPRSAVERHVIEGLTAAFEAGNVQAVVRLLSYDVRFTMPPGPLEYVGREAAGRFLAQVASTYWQDNPPRVIATRANGQPALSVYVSDAQTRRYVSASLLVWTLAGDRVRGMTSFEPRVLASFGLPQTLG